MAKSLWHADLVKMGPVTVTVKSDILKSKFSKPEAPKLDYVLLKIGNDDFSYNVESQECAMTFRGQKGKTIAIIAEGDGRQGTARVNYVGAPASQMQQMQQPTAPASQQQASQPTQAPAAQRPAQQQAAPQDGLKEAKRHVARNLAICTIAIQAATVKYHEYKQTFGIDMPVAMYVSLYQSLLYGTNASGVTDHLPLDVKLTPIPGFGVQQQGGGQ